jgi:hypothetical protein
MDITSAETTTGANIVQRAYNGDLMFYSAANGSGTWTPETVDGTRQTDSVPALAETSTGVNMTAITDNGSLMFYWAANGGVWTTWHPETVAGPGTTRFYVAPVHRRNQHRRRHRRRRPQQHPDALLGRPRPYLDHLDRRDRRRAGPNYEPSIAATSTSINITAGGGYNSLMFYWAANGTTTWHAEQVAPGGILG